MASDYRTSLSSLLPKIDDAGENAEPLLLELLTLEKEPVYDGHPALGPLLQYTGPWGLPLANEVLSSLMHRAAVPTEPARPVWRTRSLLNVAARYIDPRLDRDFLADWPECTKEWVSAVNDFERILRLRRDLHKELSI